VSKRISGINNSLYFKSIFLSKSKVEIIGGNNTLFFSENTKLDNISVKINGSHNKIIILSGCVLHSTELWIEDDYCEITIGRGTTIESAHIAVTENNSSIKIGADCMFAKEIVVRTGDSHSIIDLDTNKRLNFARSVVIGNHVWLGHRSVILKGVNIGDNSIIATSSVVTKNVAKNTLVGGTPAKILKSNVNWTRERIHN
jgi:acetyltransferase-like isoleucine patch superfamily enzyme